MAAIDRVELSPDAAGELAFLASHLDEAEKIVQKSKAMPAPATFKELFNQFPGESPESVRRLVSPLLNVHDFLNDAKIHPQEIFDLLTDALDALEPAGWGETKRNEWLKAQPRLVALFGQIDESHPFSIIQKSSHLTYAHEKVLREARIITDVRPVFQGESDDISRAVVIHKLQIDYSTAGERRRFEVALDAGDVTSLKKACQRAETKASAVRKSMPSWLVIIPREKSTDE